MTITSISLPEELLGEIDALSKKSGFAGRSELVRTAIQSLLEEQKQQQALRGKIEAFLMISYEEHRREKIAKIVHQYQRLIQTQLHHHRADHACLEIFLLKGDASRIKAFAQLFKTRHTANMTKLVVY